MQRIKVSWLIVMLTILLSVTVNNCGQDDSSQNIIGPTDNEQFQNPPTNPKDQIIDSYPQSCISLSVPFKTQVLPGTWSGTKNCGQTCVTMLNGYFNNTPVTVAAITSQNAWLAAQYNDTRYNQANGWYTSASQLRALLQYRGLQSSLLYGNTPEQVVDQLVDGCPCIAGVRIAGGNLVSSGGVEHWVLVVGWDWPNYIYVNDPGSSSGNHRRYTIATFNASWASCYFLNHNRVYIPVWE